MIDESFFDEKGEVREDRLDEFVARLQASVASGKRHIALTGAAGNALARHKRKKEAEERLKNLPTRTTEIPLLKDLPNSEFWVILEIMGFANRQQEKELFPVNGGSLGYRIELAAAFLAATMEHAAIYEQGTDSFPKDDPNFNFMQIILDLVVRRAHEIKEQRHA